MAIQPIQQYQDPSNSLVQILQGGTQQVGSILDRAIQIGRDIANKRTQQEQDLAAMRNQETAMAQRRGENLQSVLENQRRFGMEEDKFDFLRADTQRKFDAGRQDEAQRAAERAAAMGQQQSQFDQNFGLSERRLDLTEDQMRMQQEERDLERQRMDAAATPPPSGQTTPNVLAPPVAASTGLPGGIPWKQEATDRAFVKGQLLTPQNDTAIPWANPFSARPAGNGPAAAPGIPELLARPGQAPAATTATAPAVNPLTLEREYKADLEGREKAAKLYGTSKASALWDARIKEKEDRLFALESQPKNPTESEVQRRERFDWWMQNRDNPKSSSSLTPIKATASTAGTALTQAVEGSPDSFPNPYSDAFAPKGEKDADKEKRQALMERWTKNQGASERQSALGMEEDAFVNVVAVHIKDPAQKARVIAERRRVWQLAQKEKAAQETLLGGGTPTASPVDTVLGMPGIR